MTHIERNSSITLPPMGSVAPNEKTKGKDNNAQLPEEGQGDAKISGGEKITRGFLAVLGSALVGALGAGATLGAALVWPALAVAGGALALACAIGDFEIGAMAGAAIMLGPISTTAATIDAMKDTFEAVAGEAVMEDIKDAASKVENFLRMED